MTIRMLLGRSLSALAFAAGLPLAAIGGEDVLATRPAFSLGDQPAPAVARCDEVRAMSAGLDYPGYRVDLSVIGDITSVRSDGVLWHVTMCNLPDVRLMCVTYKSNGMKVGAPTTSCSTHVSPTGRPQSRTERASQSQGNSKPISGPPDVRQSRWQ
ncbi:MAG TPA: hypothetical protein VGM57_02750 [Pseudolabrys sp.]